MKVYIAALCATVLIMASAFPSAAQERRTATDAQQQAIELLAARGVAPELSKGFLNRLANTALDSRLHGHLLDAPVGAKFSQRDPNMRQDSSMTTSSHTEKHLAELASIFGITAIVHDKDASCTSVPTPCRIGKYSALIVFSPATVVGNVAYVAVKVGWTLSESEGGFRMSVYQVRLTTDGSGWRVEKINVVAVG